MLTAGNAGKMDYRGSTSTDIIMLVADGKKFSVERASAVQAGCFLVEDVNNAEFVIGKIMTMTTSGDGKIVIDAARKEGRDPIQLFRARIPYWSEKFINYIKNRYAEENA